MAQHVMTHGSRFRCLHDFTCMPLHDFNEGFATAANLEVSLKQKLFISSY